MPHRWPMTKAALLYTVLLGNVLLATREYEDYQANYREPPQWVLSMSEWAIKVFHQQSLEKPWYSIAERVDSKGLKHLINAEGTTPKEAEANLRKLLENRP